MRCLRAQKYISEFVDGSLDARKAAALERHIGKCAACREVLADFRAMAGAASRLDSPEPGDAVWRKIRSRLSIRETEWVSGPEKSPRRWIFGWSFPALKFAGATALALIMIASGIIVGVRLERRGLPAGLGDRERYTLAKLDEAEHYYQKAIKSLSEAFAAEKGTMVPQVAEIFEKNLSVVDATIQACRQAVLRGPEDLQARNYLLAAYMDKVTVLDTALEFSRKNPAAANRGKTL